MFKELGKSSNRIGTSLTVGPCPSAEPHVCTTLLSGKDPSVPGKGMPRTLLPQDDGREIHHLWEIRADGESPQDEIRIDEAGRRGDFARGAVGTDHEVGSQRLTGTQLVPADLPVRC